VICFSTIEEKQSKFLGVPIFVSKLPILFTQV
jgi:hypothetical protein